MKIVISIEERQELAKYLRRGDRAKIAKAANIDRQTVERWLKGQVQNSVAEPYIRDWVKTRKQQQEQAIKEGLKQAV